MEYFVCTSRKVTDIYIYILLRKCWIYFIPFAKFTREYLLYGFAAHIIDNFRNRILSIYRYGQGILRNRKIFIIRTEWLFLFILNTSCEHTEVSCLIYSRTCTYTRTSRCHIYWYILLGKFGINLVPCNVLFRKWRSQRRYYRIQWSRTAKQNIRLESFILSRLCSTLIFFGSILWSRNSCLLTWSHFAALTRRRTSA